MKIEIYLDGEKTKNGEDMQEIPRKPTAFHKKVAKMLAQQQGRKKVSEMDIKKAMDLDEDSED